MGAHEKYEPVLPKKPIPSVPVYQPDISPDGRRILFSYLTLNEDEDKYESHIWMAPVDGGEPRQFTYGNGSDSNPMWSPDGEKVIFLSSRVKPAEKEGKQQIWIMPSDGGEARQLTSVKKGVVGSPWPLLWSPDGKKVLFSSKTSTKVEGDEDEKSDVLVIDKLNYKLDGAGYFPDTRLHIYTVDMEDGKVTQLTKGEFDVAAAGWSPDGEKIAFVANMSDETDYTMFKDIWVVSSDGGEPKKVVTSNSWINSVSWSPDGKYLALASVGPFEKELKFRYGNIWIASSEGGPATNLTEDFDRNAGVWFQKLVWSPDSKAIYFVAPERGTRHIHKIDIETREVERITDGKMTIATIALAGNGSLFAFDASEATRLSEVWVFDGGETRRLTGLTDSLTEGLTLVEPEVFSFEASDGAEVEGWIMRPVGCRDGERYPAILEIHGGPWGNFGYTFDLRCHVLANNGYAVIFVNHRASTGYGEDFSDITGRWGDREYNDLMEAVDFVVETYPFVDSERLGVTGCSGGGYLTNWIVTQTDRFKAGVTVASISNWYSFYGCSDLGPAHILPLWEIGLGKDPWEDEDQWFERSPIRHVKNVRTPLQIIHGENDLRCPMEQAEQFFIALKKLRVPVEFIRFPGESHARITGFKKPSHTTEAFKHMLRWFDKYLK